MTCRILLGYHKTFMDDVYSDCKSVTNKYDIDMSALLQIVPIKRTNPPTLQIPIHKQDTSINELSRHSSPRDRAHNQPRSPSQWQP